MPTLPKIACLCPTYKRPRHLANAAACFQAQNYPEDLHRLFILDDAVQFADARWSNFVLQTSATRLPHLPAKYNLLAEMAIEEYQPDILAVWEDDDVFLPWHLMTIATVYLEGGRFIRPPFVYSNYGCAKGSVVKEDSSGRFHSSWAFTCDLFREVGGYPTTGALLFDQQFGAALRQRDPYSRVPLYGLQPSYVYRWGNGVYHGSQAGDAGYADLWERLGKLPAPYVGELHPQFDEETRLLFDLLVTK